MTTDQWQKTCKRCGRTFEVALWCREVTYCDNCQAELDGKPTSSLDARPTQDSREPITEIANRGRERFKED